MTLLQYFPQKPLIIFNDLLALEDRYVALKPAQQTRYFLSMEQFLSHCEHHALHFWAEKPIEELSVVTLTHKTGRAYYSGKTPLQPLSFEVFNVPLTSYRVENPFTSILSFFACESPESLLSSIHRFAKSSLDLHFIGTTDADLHALLDKIAK